MKQTHKKALLSAALLAAALAGTVLALFPSWEQHKEQERQAALLSRIEKAARQKELPPGSTIVPETAGRVAGSDLLEEKAAFEQETEAGWPEKEAVKLPKEGSEIGILTIPRIESEHPVTAGVSEKQLKISEGWVMQTDMVGSVGNAVIAGHRSYTSGLHFNRLDELEAGDEILFTAADGEAMRFIVEETLTVDPDDPAVFSLPQEGRAQLTLYTCTPIRKATHRLIVRALRLEE